MAVLNHRQLRGASATLTYSLMVFSVFSSSTNVSIGMLWCEEGGRKSREWESEVS